MTPPAQHPLSCGTCNYPHDMKDESGKWKRCPIAKCELSYERLSLIDVVGCNSHSSLRSRPAPSADAVLDELDRWAMAMTSIHDFAEKTDYGWRQSMEQLRDKIKALRVSDQLRQSRQHPNGKQDGERG